MPRPHRKWTVISSYFREVLDTPTKAIINDLLKEDKNILLFIKKDEQDEDPKKGQSEKFKKLCELYENETKLGKIIISAVPDIEKYIEL